MHDFYVRWPKHLHTINTKNQSNDEVYGIFSSNLKIPCNLHNWIAKLVYLCNVTPEYCFSIERKSLSFRLQNRTISLQLEKAILLHITNV